MSGTPTTRAPVAWPGPTGRRPWSTELLREWAGVRYPGAPLWEQVRLGPTSAKVSGVTILPALEAMLRVELWYADGIILLPNEVLCIEAKVKASPGAIGQVLFYLRLMLSTPEVQPYLAIPFVPVVLFAEDDATVNQFARQMGVRVELYTPPWIQEYLTRVQFRTRGTASSGPTGSIGGPSGAA